MRIDIRPFQTHEWTIYRDLRLRALVESPDAFARTYAEEKDRADAEWSQRLSEWVGASRRLALLARVDGRPAGLAFAQLEGAARDYAHLFSMWVDPLARRAGVARRLVSDALDWSRERGARKMILQVTETNVAAVRLYERAGFKPTNEMTLLRPGSSLTVRAMEKIF